ncbi:MAG: carbohydrate-binding protein, partial [Alistipes sp.]|nr:carbohydrate-binding protein [Alistipes sp.]
FVKVECVEAMMQGTFAIRDLRLFGHGLRQAPAAVQQARAVRNPDDDRFSMVEWSKVEDAEGYLVCFGCAPDHLNLTVQVKGNEQHDLFVHILTKGQPYYYRVDSYNDSGVTLGEVVAEEAR